MHRYMINTIHVGKDGTTVTQLILVDASMMDSDHTVYLYMCNFYETKQIEEIAPWASYWW